MFQADLAKHEKMNKATGIGFDPLFQNASMGILVADDKGLIVLSNPFLRKQFGYDAGELEGSPIEKLIPLRFRGKHEHHVDKFNTQPKTRPMGLGMDLFGLRKEGTEFPVEVSLSIYHTEHGKFTIAFISDISARKQAEQELKMLNEALEAKVASRTSTLTNTVKQLAELITETEKKDAELHRANAFLRNFWGHAEVILFVTDESGMIKHLNPAAEREMGYTAAELIDRFSAAALHDQQSLLARAEMLSKELARKVSPDFDALKARVDAGLTNELEIDYLRKDGSRFPVSLTITPISSTSDGHIEGYLGIAMNISKRRKAEEEILKVLQKEREIGEFKSRFISMASHEFRTPLSTILSSSYLIAKYTGIADQQKRERHVGRIVSMVQLLTDILNDFLSIEKIEENKVDVHLTNFAVAPLLNGIIQELEILKKPGQRIHFSHSGDTEVILDAAMLKHIVINLLSNAIKFSPEESSIEILSSATEKGYQLIFCDQGIGISQEDQKHLFERFFRGGNAAHIQGTGLGLHIVSRYMQLLQGTIHCKSMPGSGTEFKLEFSKQ